MNKVPPEQVKSIAQINRELEQRAAEIEQEQLRKLDQQFQDAKRLQETRGFAKISHKLISLWDLAKLWVQLEPGQSLVLGQDGSIHRGRVKTDKLTLLEECYTTGREFTGELHTLDNGANDSAVRTNWFVGAPDANFKNSWNQSIRLYRKEDMPGVFEAFLDALDEFLAVDPEVASQHLKYEVFVNPLGMSYYILEIPDFPYKCAVGKSGRLQFYVYNGKEIWV